MLAPIVHKLQRIKQIETVAPIRTLVNVLLSDVVGRVCGGVAGRVDALESVLEAVNDALLVCEEEAAQVHKILKSVRIGLIAGTELLNSHSWSKWELENALLFYTESDDWHGTIPKFRTALVE